MVAEAAKDPGRFLNRELSWLAFDERVLALAADPSLPLLERLRFQAIFASNLDEFFQVRVASLLDCVAGGVTKASADGRRPRQQLREIRAEVGRLTDLEEATFLDGLLPALRAAGIDLVDWGDLDEADRNWCALEFDARIFPVLTPLAVDPSHPFPYISDLSLSLAVRAQPAGSEEIRFARVKVPSLLPRFLHLPDSDRFVPVEQVIAAHLHRLFPDAAIVSVDAFRLTRSADLDLDETEADDLLAAVETELRRRRFNRAVRLDVASTMPTEVRTLLLDELELSDDDVYAHRMLLGGADLVELVALDRPDLLRAPLPVVPHPQFDAPDVDLFAAIRAQDLLVHHPYHSFRSSVEAFVTTAASDPAVLAIKMTLYRTSEDGELLQSLVRAAEEGKQVVVLVELKARFDEQVNIVWARRLEAAGAHVVYGIAGLKTHAKTVLVIRDEPGGLRRYAHVGTGNYNASTARFYEDLGLFSADPSIGDDLIGLFNYLTGFGTDTDYRTLLVAPHHLRTSLVALIRCERGADGGRIVMKMNSLVDPQLIDELYAASADGVRIDLVVRGICCLRPGVPGLSENIRVRSVVGRYLEHSRVYHFANGAGPGRPATWIGSADLMPRNLDRRVEVLVPVRPAALRTRIEGMLDVLLADDVLAWELDGDGRWHRVRDRGGSGAFESQMELHRRTMQWT